MAEYARVVGEGGLSGIVLGPSGRDPDAIAVELDNGREISVPASSLSRQPDGAWYIRSSGEGVSDGWSTTEETVVPVLDEQLDVGVRKTPVSTVRVQKSVSEHDETVSMPLQHERAEVKRVVINREVDGPLPVRREGDTVIMPVVEEVAVVEKRLMLKEEIHVTRRRNTEQHDETVTLRREHADVQRLDPSGRAMPVSVESSHSSAPVEAETPAELQDAPPPAPTGLLGPRPPTRIRKNKIIKED